MYLVDAYNKAFSKCKTNDEKTITQMKYARALQIVCKDDVGKVMVVNDFEDNVREGLLNDYDGVGIFLDWEGNRKDLAFCDIEWLKENKKDYPFVRWFNR
jgi:hypothetical protein